MKTNKLKIIAITLLCLTMISMGIINALAAISNVEEFITTEPADLGNRYNQNPIIVNNQLRKYYLVIDRTTPTGNTNISFRFRTGENTEDFRIEMVIKITNGRIQTIRQYNNDDLYMTYFPIIDMEYDNTKTYYIPVFVYNCTFYYNNANVYNIYSSTTNTQSALLQQYYELGYTTGYDNGYNQGLTDYPNIRTDMNIVEHITMLISRFTGNEIAPYITPVAVVLTILMVYFLFIRFLLSLIKAKGVIKVCDITMLVACIIILVAMYLPFININITNHNINENVETTSQDVYQISEDTEYRSYVRVVENETGTLYISKYGDVFIPKETEDIYRIEEDIITRAVQP